MHQTKIMAFLNQPYPFFYRGKNLRLFAGAIFLMVWAFNFLFEPFNVFRPEHKYSYFVISLLQAFFAAAIAFATTGFTGLFVKDQQWKVKKEFFLILLLFLFIGTGIFLGRDIVYDNPDNFSLKYFLEELRNTTLVGTLFFVFFIPFNYKRLANQHSKTANALKLLKQSTGKTPHKEVKIKTHSPNEEFYLNPEDFIYAKADGNYLEVYIVNQEKPERHIVRLTIKELTKQLSDFSFIYKTHRSYIVNTNKITKVSGNAQGYLLSTSYPLEKIPVSRSMIPAFSSRFSV